MHPVCGVVGVGERGGVGIVDEAEVESSLISSQASLVHPKISLWMRRCCMLFSLLLVGEHDFLLLFSLLVLVMVVLMMLDLLMAVRSLFCVERSHFVKRQTFLALRPSPAIAARAWRRRGLSILFEERKRMVYERGGVR